jgi:hypothetical protein
MRLSRAFAYGEESLINARNPKNPKGNPLLFNKIKDHKK